MKLLSFVFCLFISLSLWAEDLSYYLPTNVTYDSTIPTPESVLGYEVGDWHVSHDQLVYYMRALAESSDRVEIQEYARSHEHRPLVLLTVSNPDNIRNIDQIKQQRKDIAAAKNVDLSQVPAVAYMGYSIHGNEPSGGNASMLLAYYLAAAESEEVKNLLKSSVILIDPCMNPDGFHRFSTWVNSHKSLTPNADNNHREHSEVWPKGRTNHYWFDLNRDWLLLQHPESQGRVALFHEWKPNVLGDFHEMGTHATYFFQPGVPSRNNPRTPERNFELTNQLAEYHAKALDEIGSLYYTEEGFDDFYIGKGSTYPDVNGCIGILFEQASARGHLQESQHGDVSFPFSIRNQFRTSLSTINGLYENKQAFQDYQTEFFREANNSLPKGAPKAYVFGNDKDAVTTNALAELLQQHQVKVYPIQKDIKADGQTFKKEKAFLVPCKQLQGRFVQAVFEKVTTFQDSLFYDVSTWTLPLAFGLPYAAISDKDFKIDLFDKGKETISAPKGKLIGEENAYAYAFEWNSYTAPKALGRLLAKDIKVKVTNKDFRFEADGKEKTMGAGSILIPVGIQKKELDTIKEILAEIQEEDGIDVYSISGGLTKGVNIGSPSFSSLEMPKTAMIVGDGVKAYEAGEVWHHFDQRLNYPLTLIDINDLRYVQLSKYNTLIMVDGNYAKIDSTQKANIKHWVREGGLLITTKSATKWAIDQKLLKNKTRSTKLKDSKKSKSISNKESIFHPYATLRQRKGAQAIGGAIFEAEIDLTHPLAYGYTQSKIPIFRNHSIFLDPSTNPYATPVRYMEAPLLSGYISNKNLKPLANSASVVIGAHGKGKIIGFVDNPLFRGFWYGTARMFSNAVFFGPTISSASAR